MVTYAKKSATFAMIKSLLAIVLVLVTFFVPLGFKDGGALGYINLTVTLLIYIATLGLGSLAGLATIVLYVLLIVTLIKNIITLSKSAKAFAHPDDYCQKAAVAIRNGAKLKKYSYHNFGEPIGIFVCGFVVDIFIYLALMPSILHMIVLTAFTVAVIVFGAMAAKQAKKMTEVFRSAMAASAPAASINPINPAA